MKREISAICDTAGTFFCGAGENQRAAGIDGGKEDLPHFLYFFLLFVRESNVSGRFFIAAVLV